MVLAKTGSRIKADIAQKKSKASALPFSSVDLFADVRSP